MGGRVFIKSLNIESKRINKEEYLELSARISEVLSKFFQKFHIIESFKSKSSFGDIDISVLKNKQISTPEFIKLLENLKEEFGASAVIKNSEIISFLIDGFQCDLIFTPAEEYNTSKYYFDYDPSGNLAGKIAHRFGIRLGHDGLSYILRDNENTYKLGKINISSDFLKICLFLDLDWTKRCAGFETQEEIFDWIINSKYFDTRIFDFENMNHIARVRDRKRQSYNNFMKYIENYKDKIYNWPLYKEENLPLIDSFFPESNLIGNIKKLKEENEKRKELAAKFNGNIIKDLTGLEGATLGKILSGFKSYIIIGNEYQSWENYAKLWNSETINEIS